MTQPKLSDEKLRQIQELASQWGKIAARRALEAIAPEASLDFATMEEIAAAAAQGVTEGTLQALCQQQEQQLPQEISCPDCQTVVPLEHQDRPLAVQGGEILLHEPYGHCPVCRRDFFPPKDGAAAG